MTEAEAVQIIWNYHHLNHKLEKVPVMVVLGSHDLRVAEWAAQLYLEGWAPQIIVSGSAMPWALKLWGMSEAAKFKEVMMRHGVPGGSVWTDERAKNSGENAKYIDSILREHSLDPSVILCVQKPYMERRTYATLKLWWPNRRLIVTSPPISLEDWIAGNDLSRKETIDLMVGDLWRIKEYPAKGFQIPQTIPDYVWAAHDFMAGRGYGWPERPGPKTRPPQA
jgi:uncharacterized SAM-binding protein YcdF (DUF218 family)